jgi:diguanylate cyclase (GGDEF)-like protein
MNSQKIRAEALDSLGVKNFVPKEYTILAVVLPESSVLELNITGPDPVLISEMANAIGYQSILFTRSINRIYELNFLDQAVVPDAPISPVPLRDAGLSLLLGLAGGAVLAVLSEQIRVPLEAYKYRLQTDNETGVFNNKHFIRVLEEELGNKSSAILSIGIIELNGLTDLLGTLPANSLQKILRNVTEVLRRELRGNDVVGRWNKKSFIVMLPSTSGEAANRIFNRIHQSLSVPINLYQYDISLNLNPYVGGGQYSNGITAQELLQKTENALEQAKRDGANPVYVWELRNPFWVQNEIK